MIIEATKKKKETTGRFRTGWQAAVISNEYDGNNVELTFTLEQRNKKTGENFVLEELFDKAFLKKVFGPLVLMNLDVLLYVENMRWRKQPKTIVEMTPRFVDLSQSITVPRAKHRQHEILCPHPEAVIFHYNELNHTVLANPRSSFWKSARHAVTYQLRTEIARLISH
jgi:hypothetical protein